MELWRYFVTEEDQQKHSWRGRWRNNYALETTIGCLQQRSPDDGMVHLQAIKLLSLWNLNSDVCFMVLVSKSRLGSLIRVVPAT